MCEQQTVAPHTAISTWSGFVYQGKIALYYCLKLIADDYSGNRGLKLQLESQDDFAVYNGQTCISMHQVKAYKSQNFSSYQIGFTAQKDKATSDGVSSAFFHVAREITDLPEEYETIYHPVKLYDYGTQQASKKYCSLEELDTLIETLLKSIISSEASLPNWKGNLSKLIREFLEAEINQKVIAIH
ncbi:TPA: ABC-three component system protein, partial [Photobacterium damselae]